MIHRRPRCRTEGGIREEGDDGSSPAIARRASQAAEALSTIWAGVGAGTTAVSVSVSTRSPGPGRTMWKAAETVSTPSAKPTTRRPAPDDGPPKSARHPPRLRPTPPPRDVARRLRGHPRRDRSRRGDPPLVTQPANRQRGAGLIRLRKADAPLQDRGPRPQPVDEVRPGRRRHHCYPSRPNARSMRAFTAGLTKSVTSPPSRPTSRTSEELRNV